MKTGRWWNELNVPSDRWRSIVKLFVQEYPAAYIANQLQLAPNTVHHALMVVRHVIDLHAKDSLIGSKKLDETKFGCRRKRECRAAKKISIDDVPVFGIKNDAVVIIPDLTVKKLLGLAIKLRRHGSIFYSMERYDGNDFVICCATVKGNDKDLSITDIPFCRENVYSFDKLPHSEFWHWAKKKLFRHRNISPRWFPLYLKEMEFRYNHRIHSEAKIADILIGWMSGIVPQKEE